MSLFDLLAQCDIRLRHLTPGSQHHIDCPRCGGGAHRDRASLSIHIDADGQGATWTCHRGTCGWTSGVHEPTGEPAKSSPRKPPPEPLFPELTPAWFNAFWDERCISQRTLDHFGIRAMAKYGFAIGQRPAIVFPYIWQGEIHRLKYRPHPEKTPQGQSAFTETPTLYNADAIDPTKPLVWVEGEPDVLAVHECGCANVVSLRDGAPQKASFKRDDARFAALQTHAKELAKVPVHILAGDMDQPGLALREELARRLGRHKVRLVTWPDGCKDACDTIRTETHGQAVMDAINHAVPYPIEGVEPYQIGTTAKLATMKPPATMTTGTQATDDILSLPTEGKLIVLTGYSGHGKSTLARFIASHTMRKHDRRWLVFAAEDDSYDFYREIAEAITGCNFDAITVQGHADVDRVLFGRLVTLTIDAQDNPPTMGSLIERATMSVLVHGTTDFLVDPWNEIEHQRGEMSETDYISRALQQFRAFARAHGCNVWVVAHPTKPYAQKDKDGKKSAVKVPGGYDISGSANWANKCDLGLTIFRSASGKSEIHVWKSRSRRWATAGRYAKLDFLPDSSRFVDPIPAPPDDPPPNARNFNDDD